MSNPTNRRRAVEHVRNWNEAFRPGTAVTFEGRPAVTDSPAALGVGDVPGVFLVGVELLVPLDRLEVPGWERTNGRKR